MFVDVWNRKNGTDDGKCCIQSQFIRNLCRIAAYIYVKIKVHIPIEHVEKCHSNQLQNLVVFQDFCSLVEPRAPTVIIDTFEWWTGSQGSREPQHLLFKIQDSRFKIHWRSFCLQYANGCSMSRPSIIWIETTVL